MIKLAFNKQEPNLVFEINEVERVAVGDAGIKEYYKGTLIDTEPTVPVKTTEHREQVKGFESNWKFVPVEITTVDNDVQNKSATPATTAVVVTPDAGYIGLSKVTVAAVTAAIDANIVAGNIKKDVVILGVTGTYEGEE